MAAAKLGRGSWAAAKIGLGSYQALVWQLPYQSQLEFGCQSRVWQPRSPSLAAATLTPSLAAAKPEFDSCLAAVQMPKAKNPGYISGSHWDLNTIYTT